MLKWLLFETHMGAWLLALFERATGLAVVDVKWLERQPTGKPLVPGGA